MDELTKYDDAYARKYAQDNKIPLKEPSPTGHEYIYLTPAALQKIATLKTNIHRRFEAVKEEKKGDKEVNQYIKHIERHIDDFYDRLGQSQNKTLLKSIAEEYPKYPFPYTPMGLKFNPANSAARVAIKYIILGTLIRVLGHFNTRQVQKIDNHEYREFIYGYLASPSL